MQPIFNAPAAADAGIVKESSTATFMADVVDASHDVPVVVDFWAPWCGPCKTLGPQLEKAVREAKGQVRMVKINVDENQQLAAQMRIQSIPAVYAFKDGRPVDGFVGALPESQIKAFVKKVMGLGGPAASPVADALAQAKAALAEGDVGTASTFYSHILQREPDNVDALAGLGRCLLQSGDAKKARALLDRVPADAASHADVVALRSSLELAEQADKAGSPTELEARVAQNPADHEARFNLAMALFAHGQREGAVDQLLELIKRDRQWNEEAARKQLLKFFEAFGPTDPFTVASRRRLSTLLFS
ncbi:MAG TPA: thioredoxin [Candidatus Sulfotelmatobacter sp.]|nr:thioredoxin [Candidatus Sulfotelmatobacter sp.]